MPPRAGAIAFLEEMVDEQESEAAEVRDIASQLAQPDVAASASDETWPESISGYGARGLRPRAGRWRTERPLFGNTTDQLNALVGWLITLGMVSVATESTSVYWIPLDELLQPHGIEVLPGNARQLWIVPGRATTKIASDCCCTCSLLRGSFRSDGAITRIRAMQRQIGNLVCERLRPVDAEGPRSDERTGTSCRYRHHWQTGMVIVRAIVDGERDLSRLTTMRQALPQVHR
ncbi:MAG TPA: hypothetical protein VMK12_27605 [Anaeromyxobacteraceae bacterium]|nr:hypothetical protein [Anaeromyxobacteraceae bacterium]